MHHDRSEGLRAAARFAGGSEVRPHRPRHRFDPGGFGPWAGPAMFGGPFGGRGGFGRGRARRGDVRAAILALLSERPMHGYEMIQQLEERSEGMWRPSPGSVYPTLSLLEDEGLVEHEEGQGKRSFRLTDAGRQAAGDELGGRSAPWQDLVADGPAGMAQLRRTVGQFMAAFAQVMRNGTPEQQEAAEKVLSDARRKLYLLLAEED